MCLCVAFESSRVSFPLAAECRVKWIDMLFNHLPSVHIIAGSQATRLDFGSQCTFASPSAGRCNSGARIQMHLFMKHLLTVSQKQGTRPERGEGVGE